MSSPYLSEIRVFSFGYPPKGWALCNGQLLAINQNQALFSLMGTTYGGDGRTTFGLPNLQGRVSMGFGSGYTQGQASGEESHTLLSTEMPAHSHAIAGSSATATAGTPIGNFPAASTTNPYGPAASLAQMSTKAIANNSGGQPHENRSPYLTLNFCIALAGIFPSRN